MPELFASGPNICFLKPAAAPYRGKKTMQTRIKLVHFTVRIG